MIGKTGVMAAIAAAVLLIQTSATPAIAGPAILFDPANGQVIYAEEADQPWYPASLTKLMTAYLTFEALKEDKLNWDMKLVTTEKANAQPPSKVGLPVGGAIALDVAVRALIIKSANDIAMVLAETIGGSEEAFVLKMNATARRLGMSRTNFMNPNGLPDPQQVTTARDMGLLARALLRDFPEYAPVFAEHQMYVGRIRLGTHNSLLKTVAGADGMKTGFICSGGYNIVASATRDGRKLIAVVLGETSGGGRAVRASALLEYGYEHYEWKLALAPQTIDNLAFDPAEILPAQDVRKVVRSFDCGYRGAAKPRVAKLAKKSPAKKPAGTAQAAAGQPAEPAPQNTGSIAPATQKTVSKAPTLPADGAAQQPVARP